MFWFLCRNRKGNSQDLVYTGSFSMIKNTIDETDAIRQWDIYEKLLKEKKAEITSLQMKVFWQNNTLSLFTSSVLEWDNMTVAFSQYIISQSKNRYLSDDLLGTWQQILKSYDVFKNKDTWYIYFLKKQVTESGNIHEWPKEKNLDEEAARILAKEYLDWYFRFKDLLLRLQDSSGKRKEVPIKVGHDYKTKIGTIKWAYGPSLRRSMFADYEESKMTKMLQWWQYDVIKRMWWFTYFTCPRRSGKTFLLAYIALRELFKENHARNAMMRPVTVIYIGLSHGDNNVVRHYIDRMAKKFKVAKLMIYDPESHTLKLKSWDSVIWQIIFFSANQDNPGVGHFADLILIDEAVKMPNSVYEGVEPIARNEWARMVCASTMYVNAPRNFFYNELVDAEKENIVQTDIDNNIDKWFEIYKDTDDYDEMVRRSRLNNQSVWLRYTIDDNEIMADEEKEMIKRKYIKTNPARYYAELYSRFIDDNKTFNYESALSPEEELKQQRYDYVCCAYDYASVADEPIVHVLWFDKWKKKLVSIEEYELPKGTPEIRAPHIQKILKHVEWYVNLTDTSLKKNRVFFAMDGTSQAEVNVLQLKHITVHLGIKYVTGNVARQNASNEIIHNVSKIFLVENTQSLFDAESILINNKLSKLISQFDAFGETTTTTWQKTFKWLHWFDDRVNAFMIGVYFFTHYLNLVNIFINAEEQHTKQMSWQELDAFNKKKEKDMEEFRKKQVEVSASAATLNQKFIY